MGLQKDSVILLEQIRTLDKRRLREKMGRLDDATMRQVNTAISVSFGLGPQPGRRRGRRGRPRARLRRCGDGCRRSDPLRGLSRTAEARTEGRRRPAEGRTGNVTPPGAKHRSALQRQPAPGTVIPGAACVYPRGALGDFPRSRDPACSRVVVYQGSYSL